MGKYLFPWEDAWVNNIPLTVQFQRLYNLAFRKLLNMHQIKEDGWGVIGFRRIFYGETLA
jgi:hypothetical protein